jgi:hypothetical protein
MLHGNHQSAVIAGQPPFFTGTATGDVEATTSTLLDVATFTGHGVAYGQEALDWWTVTGGIIEELIGESFSISHRSLAIWSPDTDPWVARHGESRRWRIEGQLDVPWNPRRRPDVRIRHRLAGHDLSVVANTDMGLQAPGLRVGRLALWHPSLIAPPRACALARQ